MNKLGKSLFAKKLLSFLADFTPKSSVPHAEGYSVSVSTFSVSPAPRGQHELPEETILDISEMDDDLLNGHHTPSPVNIATPNIALSEKVIEERNVNAGLTTTDTGRVGQKISALVPNSRPSTLNSHPPAQTLGT